MDELYSALCECQALYPDSDLSTDSEYGEEEEEREGDEEVSSFSERNGVYYTTLEEGFPHLSPQGRVSKHTAQEDLLIGNLMFCLKRKTTTIISTNLLKSNHILLIRIFGLIILLN